jgi:hypothetical protein
MFINKVINMKNTITVWLGDTHFKLSNRHHNHTPNTHLTICKTLTVAQTISNNTVCEQTVNTKQCPLLQSPSPHTRCAISRM